MIKVIHLGDDGTEMPTIEVDDFTIEITYSGIAEMLREAAVSKAIVATGSGDLPQWPALAPDQSPSEMLATNRESVSRTWNLGVRIERGDHGVNRSICPSVCP